VNLGHVPFFSPWGFFYRKSIDFIPHGEKSLPMGICVPKLYPWVQFFPMGIFLPNVTHGEKIVPMGILHTKYSIKN
jgi:hypothetical protein